MPISSNAQHRLRKHADYQLVYKAGRKQFAKQIAYFYAPRTLAPPTATSDAPLAGPRVGLTVPKALGNAVTRNRIKRRMREVVRQNLPALRAPVDLILHPRRSVLDLPFPQLSQEVAQIFRTVQLASDKAQNASPRRRQGPA